jgi:YggT family protein
MLLLLRLIDVYSFVVLVAVIISWVGLSPRHPAVMFLNSITEPALTPIRRVIPPMGGLDLSPMVLLILLQLLKNLLV